MKNIIILLISLTLIACGGGGGETATTDTSSDTATQSASGIWRGTVTSVIDGNSYESIGLITEAGEVRFITDDGEQTLGNVTVDGSTFNASLTSYAPMGSVFTQNNSTILSGTASGTVKEKSSLSGSANYSGSVTSTFTFTYDSIYERDSSLSVIAGVYSDSDGSGYTETYSIDSLGNISGSDSDGCQFSGRIQILNSNFNVYRINLTVTNCGEANDTYSGLATLLDENGSTNDTLAVSFSGTTYVITGAVYRQ